MTLTRTGRSTIAAVILTLMPGAVATEVATAGRLKTRSATGTVPDQQHGAAEAVCPKGTKAVSGGFKTEFFGVDLDFPFIPIEASRRARSRGWTSSGFNDGTAEGDLTSFAYCRKQKLKADTDTVPAPVGEFVTASAACPAGTKIVSGGFEASPVDTVGTTPVLYVSESRRASKRRWEASAFSNGNEEGELEAAAYCAKERKPKARHASTTLDSATPSASVIAHCKRRERVVSGGFGSPDDSGEATPRFPGLEAHRQATLESLRVLRQQRRTDPRSPRTPTARGSGSVDSLRGTVSRHQPHLERGSRQLPRAAQQAEDAGDVGLGLGDRRDAVAGGHGRGAGVVGGEGERHRSRIGAAGRDIRRAWAAIAAGASNGSSRP